MTDTRVIRRRSNQILWLALAIIIILIAGTVVTLYTARQQDAAMRQELLTKTRLGFITADSQKIPLLTGSDADLTSPAYLEIKNQLATIRTADPEVRFAYFIGQHPDGTYFIFVDSEDPESPDYSPPGQEYTEISEDVKQVFVTDRETTVGPYTDRWGSWVSGYVPLHDPVSGRTIAIFGMDHNAGNWNGQILREALLPGTATLVVLLMLLFFYVIQQRKEQEHRRLEISERVISESERNFHAFFETIDDIIVVATPEGRILFANTALERILGYTTGELARMHLLDLHPADLRGEAEAIFSAILRGERNTCPLPVMAKDGMLLPVETRVWSGTWNSEDCIFGIVKDLTAEQEAQQRFERLFRNNPALMALSTLPDRKFTDVNNAFLARLGYTRDEVIGKTSFDLHLFPDPALQIAAADQLEKNGRITDLELQVRCRDGSMLDGIFSGEVIRSQGRSYFLTVMIDITERKQLERENEYHERELVRYSEELNRDIAERKRVEQALRESEERFRSFVENANDIVYSLDQDGILTYVSPNWTEVLGHETSEVVGRSFEVFVHPDDLPACRAFMEKVIVTGKKQAGIEYRVQHKDGNWRWHTTNASIIRDNSGIIVSFLGIARDISDRKKAEEELTLAAERLTLATQAGNVGIWDWDIVNNRLVWDQQMYNLYGIRADQFSGAYDAWQAGLHPDDKERGDHEINLALSGEKEFNTEFRVVWPNGTTRFIHALAIVQRDASGMPLRMIGTNWDISERKLAEQAIKKANRQLNLMTGITRHDINNKITIILGYLGMSEEKITDPELLKYYQVIDKATSAIQTQIAFTKVYQDLGTQEPQWQYLETILPHSHIPAAVTLKSDVKGVEVLADPMLERVFFNLLDNSVRHGEHVTEIRVSSLLDKNGLNIVWEDNGVGIPPDQKEKIFERGFGKNTGLGMFLTREILSLTDITIQETGEPGKGARFEITVPNGMWRNTRERA